MLENDCVLLVPLDRDDLEWVRQQRNLAEEMAGSYQRWPIGIDEQEQWFQSYLSDRTQKRFVIWKTQLKREPVGTIALTRIDLFDRCAEMGIRIAKGFWRKGYAFGAIQILSNWCFNEIGFHRLSSEVFSDNSASMNLFKKLDWHQWGTKQSAHFKGAWWQNVHCYEKVNISERSWIGSTIQLTNHDGPVSSSETWTKGKEGVDWHYTGVHCYSEPMKAGDMSVEELRKAGMPECGKGNIVAGWIDPETGKWVNA